MNKLLLIFTILLSVSSCNREHFEAMTFAKAEKGLNSTVKIPDGAQELILRKYGSVENWLDAIKVTREFDKMKGINKSSTQGITHNYYISWNSRAFGYVYDHKKFPSNQYTLDRSIELGLQWPQSCRAGACTSCLAKQHNGLPVDQSEQTFLDDNQVNAGYILTCKAYPTSDMNMTIGVEEDLY